MVRSSTSTRAIVSLTSCPYAPTFWIGVAPVEPGMPERHSMPAQSMRDRHRDEVVPRLARGDAHHRVVVIALNGDAAQIDADHDAVEAFVGDEEIAAAAEDEDALLCRAAQASASRNSSTFVARMKNAPDRRCRGWSTARAAHRVRLSGHERRFAIVGRTAACGTIGVAGWTFIDV